MSRKTVVHVSRATPDPGVVVGPIPNACRRVQREYACGGALEQGFGLAGGGYGSYGVCGTCGQMYKNAMPDDDE